MVKRYFDYMIIIRIFLGLVFLSSSLYRVFDFDFAKQEMVTLGMPPLFSIVVIILELFIAISLIMNKYKIFSLGLAVTFLFIAILTSFFGNFYFVITNLKDLFVFDANPTDIFLHITYLFLLIVLFLHVRKENI